MRYHLDTDFLVFALSARGPEHTRLEELAGSDAVIEISSIAWYEFCRGPRTPAQLVVARSFFGDEGIVAFNEPLAERAAEEFRRLGSPRRRAADVAIGVVAERRDAVLLTRNAGDFADVEGLRVEGAASGTTR